MKRQQTPTKNGSERRPATVNRELENLSRMFNLAIDMGIPLTNPCLKVQSLSEDNERNGLVIEDAAGRKIGVVQIAGLVARRILCWTKEGASVEAGSRIGMIRFGSRLDVYLPEGSKALVAVGQTAVAGETVLADLRLGDGGRTWRTD